LADRFGGKWLFGGPLLLSSVISLLSPAAAYIHVSLLISMRILSGLGEGMMLPAVYAMIARWSSPQYYSVVVCIKFIGQDAGIVLGLLLSGYLCDYGFAGGWPSVFYVFGSTGAICSLLWFYLCYNTPQTHPRISKAELEYWERVTDTIDSDRPRSTPWCEILTSIPVWALAIALFADVCFYFNLSTVLPLFLHDVVGVNMTTNGEMCTVPYAVSIFLLPFAGYFVDWVRAPGRLSTNLVRKVVFVIGMFLSSSFIILSGYVGCSRILVVTTMTVVIFGACLASTTAATNQLDLAPLHAGMIMGFTSTIAFLGAILGPMVVSAMTSEQSTIEEWRNVFFLTAAVGAIGAVVFVIFGSGNRQSWAED